MEIDVPALVAELKRFDSPPAGSEAPVTAFEHHINLNILDELVEVIQRAYNEMTETHPLAANVFLEHIKPVLDYYTEYTKSSKINLDTTNDIVNLYAYLANARAQATGLAAENKQAQANLASLCSQTTEAQTALAAVQRDLNVAHTELESTRKQLKSTSNKLKAKETALKEAMAKLTGENKELAEMERRLRDVRGKHAVLKQSMDGLREDQAEILEKHISRGHFDNVVLEIEKTVNQLQEVVDSVPIDMQDD